MSLVVIRRWRSRRGRWLRKLGGDTVAVNCGTLYSGSFAPRFFRRSASLLSTWRFSHERSSDQSVSLLRGRRQVTVRLADFAGDDGELRRGGPLPADLRRVLTALTWPSRSAVPRH